MARSTRKSLAGGAAAAAKKVVGRSRRAAAAQANGTSKPTATSATKKTAKKTPAKKAAATKAATKATAKKAATTKTAASKKSATKAPAKKTTAKKATTAKKTTAKKTPVKKTTTKKATKTAATSKAPAKKAAKKAATKTPAKKTSRARKAPASSLVVKADESAWTKAELAEVLADLHEHRDKLVQHLEEAERELAGLMRDSGDGAGHDQADVGSSSFERDHELTVVNNERDMLAQTDRALARIDDGTYGVCESCGQPIGKMRLMAFPRATLCLSCKQREERR
jgi:RNA polymerase-binding protein DksA